MTNDSFDVSAVARSAGLRIFPERLLGLTPQALCCRPLRGLGLGPSEAVLRQWQ